MGFMTLPGVIEEVEQLLTPSNLIDTGSGYLITSSRFKGLEDTAAYFSDGMMHWTSRELKDLAEEDPSLAASRLQESDPLQLECIDSFKRKLLSYLKSLHHGAESFFSRLGFSYRADMSVERIVDRLADSLYLNGFVPIGSYVSANKPPLVNGGMPQFGSFYFHSVFVNDPSWSLNFQTRVSLHVGNPNGKDGGVSRPVSDYELGDFFATERDAASGDKIVTEYGIDLDTFDSWVRVKALIFRRKQGYEVRDDQLKFAIGLYEDTTLRLYSEMTKAISMQRSVFNSYSIYLAVVALLKKERFPSDSFLVPGIYEPKSWVWDTKPGIVVVPNSRDSDPASIEAYIEKLVSRDPASVDSFRSYLSLLSRQCGRMGDLFQSYQTHLRELLENLEVLSTERELYGVSIEDLILSYINFFDTISAIFPRYQPALDLAVASVDRSLVEGSLDTLYLSADAQAVWRERFLVPVVPGSKDLLTTNVARLWDTFYGITVAKLGELNKKIKLKA